MNHDLINAVFEMGGAALLTLNIVRLLRDKTLAGVSIFPTAWWTAWGMWNLFYYPSLGQWASFTAGLFVVAFNLAWVVLAVRYRLTERRRKDAPR